MCQITGSADTLILWFKPGNIKKIMDVELAVMVVKT